MNMDDDETDKGHVELEDQPQRYLPNWFLCQTKKQFIS
jgi:hypothetical protein